MYLGDIVVYVCMYEDTLYEERYSIISVAVPVSTSRRARQSGSTAAVLLLFLLLSLLLSVAVPVSTRQRSRQSGSTATLLLLL